SFLRRPIAWWGAASEGWNLLTPLVKTTTCVAGRLPVSLFPECPTHIRQRPVLFGLRGRVPILLGFGDRLSGLANVLGRELQFGHHGVEALWPRTPSPAL